MIDIIDERDFKEFWDKNTNLQTTKKLEEIAQKTFSELDQKILQRDITELVTEGQGSNEEKGEFQSKENVKNLFKKYFAGWQTIVRVFDKKYKDEKDFVLFHNIFKIACITKSDLEVKYFFNDIQLSEFIRSVLDRKKNVNDIKFAENQIKCQEYISLNQTSKDIIIERISIILYISVQNDLKKDYSEGIFIYKD